MAIIFGKKSLLFLISFFFIDYISAQNIHEKNNWINIIDNQCVYNNNNHAAFTTLTEWRGSLILAFREGMNHHQTKDSKGVIKIKKKNKRGWNTQHVLIKEGDDLRDPFFLKKNDTLFLYSSIYYSILTKGDWSDLKPIKHKAPFVSSIWKKRIHNNEIYGVGNKWGKWPLLMHSKDGINWQMITEYRIGGNASEADMVFIADTMYICIRIDSPIGSNSLWGKSVYPYTECQWSIMDISIASPEMFLYSEEIILLAGREYNYNQEGANNEIYVTLLAVNKEGKVICKYIVDKQSIDQGYPSIIKDKRGKYYMSFYTGDEEKTEIRLLTFKINDRELKKNLLD